MNEPRSPGYFDLEHRLHAKLGFVYLPFFAFSLISRDLHSQTAFLLSHELLVPFSLVVMSIQRIEKANISHILVHLHSSLGQSLSAWINHIVKYCFRPSAAVACQRVS